MQDGSTAGTSGSTIDLDAIVLARGNHETREDGVCAMELVAWMAGEEHSDHPACVSPVLSTFLRRWNDDLDDVGRQRLKPYLRRVIGTAGDGHDETRGWMLTDWMVRVHTPAWLDLAGITAPAAALRGLPAITDICSMTVCSGTLEWARKDSAAAWAAARAAAWDAARAAARAAARDAARDAARAASKKILEPTVISLQQSAFELLDRLIDPARKAA